MMDMLVMIHQRSYINLCDSCSGNTRDFDFCTKIFLPIIMQFSWQISLSSLLLQLQLRLSGFKKSHLLLNHRCRNVHATLSTGAKDHSNIYNRPSYLPLASFPLTLPLDYLDRFCYSSYPQIVELCVQAEISLISCRLKKT